MNTSLSICFLLAAACFAADQKNRKNMTDPSPWPCYQPLVIIGEGWSQRFVIQNVGEYKKIPFKGTLRFFTQLGQPWSIDIVGRGQVSSIPLDIPVFGSLTIETVVMQFRQQLGWAMIQVEEDLDDRNYIHAQTIFRRQEPGRPDLMTAAPMSDIFTDDSVMYFDNTEGKSTGLAVLNSRIGSTSSLNFTMTFYGEDGQPFHRVTRQFRSGEMWWIDMANQFPATANRKGQVVIQGGFGDSQAFSLQFTPNGAFTAISTTADF
jgi:hypothetical protein